MGFLIVLADANMVKCYEIRGNEDYNYFFILLIRQIEKRNMIGKLNILSKNIN